MFRLKIIITFIVSVLAATLTGYFAHKLDLSEAMIEDADEALRRSASVAEQRRRLEEATMVSKANFVARGPDLYDAINADYADIAKEQAGGGKDGEEEGKKDKDEITLEDRIAHERHLKVYERLLRYKKEFDLYYEQGPGKDLRTTDVPLLWRKPTKPDLYIAVDNRGIGLAALGKDLLKWFGDDVSQSYPLISEVLVKKEVRTALIRWSFDKSVKPENRPLYLVAMAPIRPSVDDDPAGVVVIGSLINDGNAKAIRAHMAGVAGQDVEENAQTKILSSSPHLAYYYGERIIGSTLDTTAQTALQNKLFKEQKLMEQEGVEKSATVEINDKKWLVRARALPGKRNDKVPAGFVALTDTSQVVKPLSDPGTYTLIVGVLIGLIGIVLLLVFIQSFIKPLEQVESGIQEVIAGNKEYEFTYNGSNKIAVGLAQQLNLMSAFLQGKPMPDDDEASGNWGALDPGSAGKSQGGPSQVQGVSMSDLMGKKPKKDEGDDET